MSNLNAFVEKYISIWNEPDSAKHRWCIRELWVEDAHYLAKTLEAVGHHGKIKLRWEMLPAAGGDVISVGFDFLVLAEDGRIRTGYRFIES